MSNFGEYKTSHKNILKGSVTIQSDTPGLSLYKLEEEEKEEGEDRKSRQSWIERFWQMYFDLPLPLDMDHLMN